jgi:hypothetical protein
MDSLDNTRFNAFKVERFNWSRTVPSIAPLPATLEEALHAASTHRTVSISGSINSATAFVVGSKKAPKPSSKPASKAPSSKALARAAAAPPPAAPPSYTSSKLKAYPTRPCKFCSEPHWDSDCPLVLAAKKDKPSLKKTIHVVFSKVKLSNTGQILSTIIDNSPIIVDNTHSSVLIANPDPVLLLDDCLLLNNQASASVFKDEDLLEDLHPCVP